MAVTAVLSFVIVLAGNKGLKAPVSLKEERAGRAEQGRDEVNSAERTGELDRYSAHFPLPLGFEAAHQLKWNLTQCHRSDRKVIHVTR